MVVEDGLGCGMGVWMICLGYRWGWVGSGVGVRNGGWVGWVHHFPNHPILLYPT